MTPHPQALHPPVPTGHEAPDLLLVFLGAIVAIVGAVVAVAVVDSWWILVPVMALDVAVTGAVMGALWRLFDDPERGED